jgi:hypothetical protein
MKTYSAKRIILASVAFLLGGFSVLYWPVPIEGFWSSPVRVMGPAISFYLLKDGKIIHYIESGKVVAWAASYERIGWNRYQINYPDSPPTNYIFRTGLFKSKGNILGAESKRIRDDSRCIQVYNSSPALWITPTWAQSILVVAQDGYKEFFFNGRKMSLEDMETRIISDRLKLENSNKPLQIYSSTNYVPRPILDSINKNGFEYVLHTNQNWVMNLDKLYLQVSRNQNTQLNYSIKRIRDYQFDIKCVDIERIEREFGGAQADTLLYDYRSRVIDIITHSSFNISPLLDVMNNLNQKYNIITNNVWIERTDRHCWSLLYFEGDFLGYCHFNGHGDFTDNAKYDIDSFRRYRENINRPFVVYVPNRQVPVELIHILESNHISYTVKPHEVLRKKEYH